MMFFLPFTLCLCLGFQLLLIAISFEFLSIILVPNHFNFYVAFHILHLPLRLLLQMPPLVLMLVLEHLLLMLLLLLFGRW